MSSTIPLDANTGANVFNEGIYGALELIAVKHPEIHEVIGSVRETLSRAFYLQAVCDPKSDESGMFAELTEPAPEVLWALCHMGFLCSRPPGDQIHVRVFAKPSKEFEKMYMPVASAPPPADESNKSGGGASAVPTIRGGEEDN